MQDGLLLCGLDPADLGIISPYRAQVKLIRSLMAKVDPRLCRYSLQCLEVF